MHSQEVYRRNPIFEPDGRRSPGQRRPTAIAVPATHAMPAARLFAEAEALVVLPWLSVLPTLRRLPAMIGEWRRRARSRRDLLGLNDYLLKDIGITRAEAQYEAAKSFWR